MKIRIKVVKIEGSTIWLLKVKFYVMKAGEVN